MAWVNVSKPSGSSWANSNPQGKETYDQPDLTYDSAVTFYDGLNPDAWTDVAKPSSSSWANVPKPT